MPAIKSIPSDDQLNRHQLAAMQAADDALRAGEISQSEADEIAALIRQRHVAVARRRLTAARRS